MCIMSLSKQKLDSCYIVYILCIYTVSMVLHHTCELNSDDSILEIAKKMEKHGVSTR